MTAEQKHAEDYRLLERRAILAWLRDRSYELDYAASITISRLIKRLESGEHRREEEG